MPIRPIAVDRAAGVLLGEACGDALGVPYEMAAPPVGEAVMKGGGLGPYEPGEWSDDTQMTLCVARVAAQGIDLTSPEGLDAVAEAFTAWLDGGATDVGTQTRSVLTEAKHLAGRTARPPDPRQRGAARADRADGRQRGPDAHAHRRAVGARGPRRDRAGRARHRPADPRRPAGRGLRRAVVGGDPGRGHRGTSRPRGRARPRQRAPTPAGGATGSRRRPERSRVGSATTASP